MLIWTIASILKDIKRAITKKYIFIQTLSLEVEFGAGVVIAYTEHCPTLRILAVYKR